MSLMPNFVIFLVIYSSARTDYCKARKTYISLESFYKMNSKLVLQAAINLLSYMKLQITFLKAHGWAFMMGETKVPGKTLGKTTDVEHKNVLTRHVLVRSGRAV